MLRGVRLHRGCRHRVLPYIEVPWKEGNFAPPDYSNEILEQLYITDKDLIEEIKRGQPWAFKYTFIKLLEERKLRQEVLYKEAGFTQEPCVDDPVKIGVTYTNLNEGLKLIVDSIRIDPLKVLSEDQRQQVHLIY